MSPADPPDGWAAPDDIVDALAPKPEPETEPADDAPTAVDVSGDRRRLAVTAALVLATVGVLVFVLLRSDGDGARAAEIRSVLAGRTGEVDGADLDCLARAVVDDLGGPGVDALGLGQIGPGDGLPPELLASLQVATATCDVSFDPDAPPTSDPGAGATADPAAEDLAERYRTRYPSITPDQARCLAETDLEVRRTGGTPDPAEVLGRIDACGVPREVLGLETTTTGP